MYRIPSVTGLGLSQFFQLSFNVKLARLLPFICLRIYLYLLGFIYFSLKRTDRKRIILCLNYVPLYTKLLTQELYYVTLYIIGY